LQNGPICLGAAPARQSHYWHVAILNDPRRVLQLNVPLDFKYSVVYQKVQSSTGSIARLE